MNKLNEIKKEVLETLKELDKVEKNKAFFKVGDEVFFTAFLKSNKEVFYMCKGIIKGIPKPTERQLFKVQITEIGLTSISGVSLHDLPQTVMLNRIITKQYKELHKDVATFMQPKKWIGIM